MKIDLNSFDFQPSKMKLVSELSGIWSSIGGVAF